MLRPDGQEKENTLHILTDSQKTTKKSLYAFEMIFDVHCCPTIQYTKEMVELFTAAKT